MKPSVHAEINVMGSLREQGRDLAWWIDLALEGVIDPVLDAAGRSVAAYNPKADEMTPLGQPGELSMEITWTPSRGRPRFRPWEEEHLLELKAQITKDKVKHLELSATVIDASGFGNPQQYVSLSYQEHRLGATPISSLRATAPRDLYGETFGKSQQKSWEQVFKESASVFRPAYGYLTIDFIGRSSPYEQSVGRGSRDALRECDTWARGYYWGNILSRGHIERLGGLERVLAESPGATTEVLVEDDPIIYLKLSDDLDDFSDDDLCALRDFMSPILPDGAGLFWEGLPWRVVTD